jgi:hypothetical protein
MNQTNTTLLNQTAYQMFLTLDQYNFCNNCNKTNGNFDVPDGSYTKAKYDSYWHSVYWMLGIFITFRVLVVVSLQIQDSKFGNAAGDTRNEGVG